VLRPKPFAIETAGAAASRTDSPLAFPMEQGEPWSSKQMTAGTWEEGPLASYSPDADHWEDLALLRSARYGQLLHRRARLRRR
jgi:hypothetical protein